MWVHAEVADPSWWVTLIKSAELEPSNQVFVISILLVHL